MAKLDGKVAVATGASGGIGELRRRRSPPRGRRGGSRGQAQGAPRRARRGDGREAIAVECDITDEKLAHNLVRSAAEEYVRVDILVNNAGGVLLSEVGKGLSDQWRQMFEVNVSCTYT